MRVSTSRIHLLKDLSFVFFAAVGGTLILAHLDAFEWLYRRSRPFDHYDFDEIVVFMSLFLAIGLLWFSVRRIREAKLEIAERRQVEELLNQLNVELEQRVELRTARCETELGERKRAEGKLIRYQNRLRSLSSELSLTEERERQRIAADLHDHLGHTLALANNRLAVLAGALSPDQAGSIEDVKLLIERAIRSTRSLIFEVSPPILDHFPFAAAVEWLAGNILGKSSISFHLTVDEGPWPLADDTRLLLFKAIRELLVNIVKHSRAHEVEISIRREADSLAVGIEDDGIGFDLPEDQAPAIGSSGFGLLGVRERLTYLNGRFSINSTLNRGTSIGLMVPLAKEEAG
jgi:signal transduction histidine kinase